MSSSQSTFYAGNYIYKKGNSHGQSDVALTFFNSEEGYIEPVFKSIGVISDFDYVYQYKDHLGNIRLSYQDMDGNGVIDPTTEIKEENHYYPFGLKHKGYNNIVTGRNHEYGYSSKEESNDNLGLKWLGFGARNYNASIARWMNIDPLAERYANYTPYNYVANTPLQAIDPDGRLIVFIGGLRKYQESGDQKYGRARWINDWFNFRPGIYDTDVTRYWSTKSNSFGQPAQIDQMFMDAYNDDRAVYLSGSSLWRSSAARRAREGRAKGELFHKIYSSSKNNPNSKGIWKLKPGETIKVVAHSQGAAHAVGFVSQLLTYKDENGGNLYNVEIIYYLNPHQPEGITNPKGVTGVQYSVKTDAISSIDPWWLPNGGSELKAIKNITHGFKGKVFPDGEAGGALSGKRGGHNVNDGQRNILKIINYFCRNNPGKCNEIKLEKKE